MKELKSPVEWKPLFKYNLASLRDDFQIADFERELNNKHVRMLKDAIMENKFYNNMISVTNTEKPWIVFDGQHRLSALWLCHIEEGLKSYNLMLGMYPKEYARIAYRRINMGKPLKLNHHVKALDDKTNPFFTELEPWLSHHPRPDKPLYVSMIQAIVYTRSYGRQANIENIDYIMDKIIPKEIEIAKRICIVTKKRNSEIFGERMYSATIYRNIYKITYKNNLDENQIDNLISLMLQDKTIKEISKTRESGYIHRIHDHTLKSILPEVLKN